MLQRLRAHNRIRNVNTELVRLYVRKMLHQRLSPRPEHRTALAILGCQRSGTSVMSRVFFRDLDCTVFREKSRLTGGAEGLRYRPFEEVRDLVFRERAQLIVFKMLVESQRANEFLEALPDGRALWLFRNYRDVANSNLNKFGERNGIDDLRPIMAGDRDDWRSQNCSAETRAIVAEYFSEDMLPGDAAALFWLARNRLFLEQSLAGNQRVLTMAYETFVGNPERSMRKIYNFCGKIFTGSVQTGEVRASSVAKGRALELSPAVESLCQDMLRPLEEAAARSD